MKVAVILIGHLKYLQFYEHFRHNPLYMALIQTQLRNLYDRVDISELDLYISSYTDNMMTSETNPSHIGKHWSTSMDESFVYDLYSDLYGIDPDNCHIELHKTSDIVDEASIHLNLEHVWNDYSDQFDISNEPNKRHFINSRSSLLKTKKAIKFFTEKSHSKDYDLVIRTRPDFVFMKKLPFFDYSLHSGVFILTNHIPKNSIPAFIDTVSIFTDKSLAIKSGGQYEYFAKLIKSGDVKTIGNFHTAWSYYFITTYGRDSLFPICPPRSNTHNDWGDIPFKRSKYWERHLNEIYN